MHREIREQFIFSKTNKRTGGKRQKQQQVPEYLKTIRPQTAINKPRKSVITAERDHIYNLLSKPINLN